MEDTSEKYNQVYRSRKKILLDNFLGGIFWSLGTFVGLAVIALIAGYFLSKINLVPIIGDWVAQILNHATKQIQTPTVR